MAHNKLYLLTGSSQGLGRAVRDILVQDPNVTLIATLRRGREPRGSKVISAECDFLDNAHYYQQAVSRALHVAHMGDRVYHEYHLINCAAIAEGDSEAIFKVNLVAPAALCETFAAYVQDHSHATRRICNVTSGYASLADGKHWAYAASKAGLDHMTRCLHLRWGHMEVDSFSPGPMNTRMGESWAPDPSQAARQLVDWTRSPQFARAPRRPEPPPNRQIREDGKVMR